MNKTNMKIYLAPMEGITGYLYRNAHHTYFGNVDKYFTPFIVPNQNRSLSAREFHDVCPEYNQGMTVIPQILTNKAEDFLWAAGQLKQFGYDEVNFNLGCPSKTVVSKKKGSGFLAHQVELNRFLDEVFSKADLKISIKTRLGKDSPEEFYELIQIFNQYPIEELIIHPRIQTDYYKNKPNLEVFRDALHSTKIPVCYNGNLFTASAYDAFTTEFPEVETIMLGRGMIANPALADEIQNHVFLDKQQLRLFHDTVCQGYQERMSGDRNVLFKMKELWSYMICVFSNYEKYGKRIRKTERLNDYEAIVSALFEEQDIIKDTGFSD